MKDKKKDASITPSFWEYLCSDEWEEYEWDDWDGGEEE